MLRDGNGSSVSTVIDDSVHRCSEARRTLVPGYCMVAVLRHERVKTFVEEGCIFAVAYLLRLAYLHQIAASPFFDFLELDPRYYHDWAIAIAGGDWIGRRVFEQAPLYPYLMAMY